MTQYLEMKKKHPDAILLFRVGDFYETFSEDAIAASEILGITLTRRANGKATSVELAGFPHHALDSYLPKLVRAGRRVAICEQLEDPKLTKKLVKRGITELVTPGVNTSSRSLPAAENNFLAAVHVTPKKIGLAFLDISTGEFLCVETTPGEASSLLASMNPKEVLRMKGTRNQFEELFNYHGSVFELDDWVYSSQAAQERLLKQFSTSTLKGFGIHEMPSAVIAAGSILHYLDLTEHSRISHITSLGRIDSRNNMHLDSFTLRNLEIIDPVNPEGKSLLDVIDKTSNPMGSRKLRMWLHKPLLDAEAIKKRQEGVQAFVDDPSLLDNSREDVKKTGDLLRICGRIATAKVSPREMLQLADGIESATRLKELLASSPASTLRDIAASMTSLDSLVAQIRSTVNPECADAGNKEFIIAHGVNEELDYLKNIWLHGREALDEIQQRETEKTGISSLKIGFNNVFGYYLEVRNTHRDKVPEEWIRKQTLVNAERYVTPELKDYEEKIYTAKEKIEVLEREIFNALIEKTAQNFGALRSKAEGEADTDCLLSFARCAVDYGYVKPEIDNSTVISITDGRHPVIERTLPPGEPYISNSLTLDSNVIAEEAEGCQIMMITGPNMSGKSALLRQTALIVLLAQTGSFVPAAAARIGIIDKIFTRVGASDSISTGESTFMMEMNEAASILNNMGTRSLIIFDELGRGTSTYDGISIAWSIVEHIHENGRFSPKTLFATHYHELNEMEEKFPRIKNYNVSVREIDGKVVFLRKLEKGGSEHSFGIHVARLAGLPKSILKRASQVLSQLEQGVQTDSKTALKKGSAKNIEDVPDAVQMSFFQLDDPLLSQIRDLLLDLNINNLTPVQALNTLNDLQGLLTGKN